MNVRPKQKEIIKMLKFNFRKYVDLHKLITSCRPGLETDMKFSKMDMKISMKILKSSIFFLIMIIQICTMFGHVMKSNKAAHLYYGNRKSSYLDVIHQNIPGISNLENIQKYQQKVQDYIDIIFRKYRPDVLIISEADSSLLTNLINPGYRHYTGTSTGNKIRVSAFVKSGFQVVVKPVNSQVPTIHLQLAGWNVIGVYREWSMDGNLATSTQVLQDCRFLDLMQKISKVKGKTTILGDFNFCSLDRQSAHQKKFDTLRRLTDKFLVPIGYSQLMVDWTRAQRGQTPACLDHVYINDTSVVTRLFNKNVLATDHNIVGVRISIKKPPFRPKSFLYRDIEGIDPEEFNSLFERSVPQEIYAATNVDVILETLEMKLGYCLEKLAPWRKVVTRAKFAPWVNEEIREEMRVRDELREKAIASKVPEDWSKFKFARNKVTKLLKSAKKQFLTDKIAVEDSKKSWNAIKYWSATNKKQVDTGKMVLETPEGIIENDQEVANYLNQYFKDKVVRLQTQTKPDTAVSSGYAAEHAAGKQIKEFGFTTVSTRTVKFFIRKMKNTASMGRDMIPVKVLKRLRHTIAPPLRHLCNQAIMQSRFPRGWKFAMIKPLFKKGSRREPKNWRPVCLLPNMSKVLEGIMNQQLRNHLETNELMPTLQHGYRAHKSCVSAWIEIDTAVAAMRDKGMVTCLLATDQSAAFNLVTADTILSKLRNYNVDDRSCRLIRSYLTGRQTICCIGDCRSTAVTLQSGVGEGSIVGPLFFSIVLCCIAAVGRTAVRRLQEERILADIRMRGYADDVSAVIGCLLEADLQRSIDVFLEEMERYCSAAGLVMNPDKSEVVVFRRSEAEQVITAGGQPETQKLKLLGVTVEANYCFDDHVKTVAASMRNKVSNIARIAKYMSTKKLIEVLEALVLSTARYAIEVWGSSLKNQQKIQKAINDALRLIYGAGERDSITPLIAKARWLNAANLWRLTACCTMRRLMNTRMAPETFGYIYRGLRHLHGTRYTNVTLDWVPVTSYARNSFIFKAVEVYNALRLNSTLFEDDEDFKSVVKAQLKQKYGNGNI